MNLLLIKKYFKQSWWHWIPGVGMLLAFIFLHNTVHNLLNPDLIAYFSIAQHYKDSDFIPAFNSYWSPLICWMMALTPGLKSNPLLVFRIINIAVALLLYQQLYFWTRRVLITNFNRLFCCVLLAMLSVHYALNIGTPDFLSCLCFFIFLRQLINFNFSVMQSVSLGIAVLFCYFSKTFLLPLCFSIIFFYFIYIYFFQRKNISFLPIAISFIVIFSGLFIWASCLKLHYGFYTLSSSGSFNLILPTTEPLSLMPLPFKEALFPWEDPYYINITFGHQGKSAFTLKQLLIRWGHNWKITLYLFRFLSFLWIGILTIPFLGFFQKKNNQWKICLLLFTVFFMNWFGYFLVFIHERYLIIGQYALYLSVLGYLEIILRKYYFNLLIQKTKKIVFLFVFFCMSKNSVQEYMFGTSQNQWMQQQVVQAEVLAHSKILEGKHIAGFSKGSVLYDYISLACFEGGGKYYWEVLEEKSIELQWKEIQQYDLDYLILYDCDYFAEDCDKKAWLSYYPVVYRDPVMKIKIIKIKQ